MSRPRLLLACCLVAITAFATGCGNEIEVPKTAGAERHGAELFRDRCAGCHTLDAADSFGSRPEGEGSGGGERTDGPNFNVRKETREDVLYAIRNGGFSGAIMPANIVLGKDAQDVALFVERYAGAESEDSSGESK
jgi:mono/diheme cytochrome c family protein